MATKTKTYAKIKTDCQLGDLDIMRKNTPQQPHHVPVLLRQVKEQLAPRPGESYLDLTAGYGGHARAIIAATEAPEKATLVDRDLTAIETLNDIKGLGTRLVHDNYAHFAEKAVSARQKFDMILVDLGVSSPQLDRAIRGFSIQHDGPLDMRMDQTDSQTKTAGVLVNTATQAELEHWIGTYGEEPMNQARRIARAIIANRPIHTTKQLATVITNNHRGRRQKTHPATRTFQAFRIAVNDELGQLERLLKVLPELLEDGGRVAIISFHSLEDRLVKRFFREQAEAGYEARLDLLTRKAIRGKIYDVHNPRARSAVLRAAVKK